MLPKRDTATLNQNRMVQRQVRRLLRRSLVVRGNDGSNTTNNNKIDRRKYRHSRRRSLYSIDSSSPLCSLLPTASSPQSLNFLH
jgi:hypothetical protein